LCCRLWGRGGRWSQRRCPAIESHTTGGFVCEASSPFELTQGERPWWLSTVRSRSCRAWWFRHCLGRAGRYGWGAKKSHGGLVPFLGDERACYGRERKPSQRAAACKGEQSAPSDPCTDAHIACPTGSPAAVARRSYWLIRGRPGALIPRLRRAGLWRRRLPEGSRRSLPCPRPRSLLSAGLSWGPLSWETATMGTVGLGEPPSATPARYP
jgi:hypothetical protein